MNTISHDQAKALNDLADAYERCEKLGLRIMFHEDETCLRAENFDCDERIEWDARSVNPERIRYIAEKLSTKS
jgi:hypothetical protein